MPVAITSGVSLVFVAWPLQLPQLLKQLEFCACMPPTWRSDVLQRLPSRVLEQEGEHQQQQQELHNQPQRNQVPQELLQQDQREGRQRLEQQDQQHYRQRVLHQNPQQLQRGGQQQSDQQQQRGYHPQQQDQQQPPQHLRKHRGQQQLRQQGQQQNQELLLQQDQDLQQKEDQNGWQEVSLSEVNEPVGEEVLSAEDSSSSSDGGSNYTFLRPLRGWKREVQLANGTFPAIGIQALELLTLVRNLLRTNSKASISVKNVNTPPSTTAKHRHFNVGV